MYPWTAGRQASSYIVAEFVSSFLLNVFCYCSICQLHEKNYSRSQNSCRSWWFFNQRLLHIKKNDFSIIISITEFFLHLYLLLLSFTLAVSSALWRANRSFARKSVKQEQHRECNKSLFTSPRLAALMLSSLQLPRVSAYGRRSKKQATMSVSSTRRYNESVLESRASRVPMNSLSFWPCSPLFSTRIRVHQL